MATIFQINISTGGLPKHGLPKAEILELGLSGDLHRDMVHHGGPDRAVCLYSLERLMALQAENHPAFPGAMGENITISGLDWEKVVPGVKIRLGEEVILEVTQYTVPCNHLIPFLDHGQISRVSQSSHPGWSRVYARVVSNGKIKVGDRVEIN